LFISSFVLRSYNVYEYTATDLKIFISAVSILALPNQEGWNGDYVIQFRRSFTFARFNCASNFSAFILKPFHVILYAPSSFVNDTLHLLRRNWLIHYVTEETTAGTIKVTGRRGRRRKQLLDDLKETRGKWQLKKEELDLTLR
jgi:hypothetical protein